MVDFTRAINQRPNKIILGQTEMIVLRSRVAKHYPNRKCYNEQDRKLPEKFSLLPRLIRELKNI